MPERPRWTPDDQLVAVILAGGAVTMATLSDADRSWAVAALTLAGHTAEDIADRMSCSLRLVRAIRAADMTALCTHLQRETEAFSNELRMASSEIRGLRIELDRSRVEVCRLREQLDRVLDAHMVGVRLCGRCQTPMDGYNLYVHNGKQYCRECHRRRQAEYRSRCSDKSVTETSSPPGASQRSPSR